MHSHPCHPDGSPTTTSQPSEPSTASSSRWRSPGARSPSGRSSPRTGTARPRGRRLHGLPVPTEFTLAPLAPFTRLVQRIDAATTRSTADRSWLRDHLTELQRRYTTLPERAAHDLLPRPTRRRTPPRPQRSRTPRRLPARQARTTALELDTRPLKHPYRTLRGNSSGHWLVGIDADQAPRPVEHAGHDQGGAAGSPELETAV